ncbi:MAG: menaquinone biosynthetic enzyme MqnA/MqnD family protein [Chthoniobacterales bacterium]
MTASAADSLRIGCVKYLNAQPLIYGWPGPVDFDHPAALCRKLAAGELDVAFVSSFEFLRDPSYTIVDHLAVASDGAVGSVFVSLGGALEEIEEIALDPASGTSVHLLRCLLAERNLHPRLTTACAENEPAITDRAARLMIGDQAIRFRAQNGDRYGYLDLGAEWKRQTNLPFVFALWLLRPEVAEPGKIAEALRNRRDQNLAHLDDLIAAHPDFSPEFCVHYFRENLRFEFGEAEKQGLLRFRSLCEQHGILSPGVSPLRLV